MTDYGTESKARRDLESMLNEHGYELEAFIVADAVDKNAAVTRKVTVRASRVVE